MAAIRIRRGRGVRRVEGTMNKLEERYAAYLELRRVCGEILEWHFDAIKLRLAKDTFYTPDFLVLMHGSKSRLPPRSSPSASWLSPRWPRNAEEAGRSRSFEHGHQHLHGIKG
jgi:hypothetical protein